MVEINKPGVGNTPPSAADLLRAGQGTQSTKSEGTSRTENNPARASSSQDDRIDTPLNADTASNRAANLGNLLEGIDSAVDTITRAQDALEKITQQIIKASEVAEQALDPSVDAETVKGLEGTFNALLKNISIAARNGANKGQNLLAGDKLTVNTNETGGTRLTIEGADVSAAGLNINQAGLESGADVAARISELDIASERIKALRQSFEENLNTLQEREVFAKGLIATLQNADAFEINDQNEEGANLLALKTKQQLGFTNSSLAEEARSAIVSLF